MPSTVPSSPPEPSTRKTLRDWGAAVLESEGREEPHRTATWLLVDTLDCRQVDLYLHPEERVQSRDAEMFAELIRRRADGEPLQHILGYDEFFGLHLSITSDVLIPRPETEELVEQGLRRIEDVDAPRVFDVGTGSGCIALAIAAQRPGASVAACDVSPDALAVARRNADRLDLDVSCFEADLFAEAFIDRCRDEGAVDLDLLVSNPPYIPDAEADELPAIVRSYDPPVALFAGEDPLRFYRRLARTGRTLCRPGGWIALETHATYADDAADVLRAAGWEHVDVTRDLAGRPRFAIGNCPGESPENGSPSGARKQGDPSG